MAIHHIALTVVALTLPEKQIQTVLDVGIAMIASPALTCFQERYLKKLKCLCKSGSWPLA